MRKLFNMTTLFEELVNEGIVGTEVPTVPGLKFSPDMGEFEIEGQLFDIFTMKDMSNDDLLSLFVSDDKTYTIVGVRKYPMNGVERLAGIRVDLNRIDGGWTASYREVSYNWVDPSYDAPAQSFTDEVFPCVGTLSVTDDFGDTTLYPVKSVSQIGELYLTNHKIIRTKSKDLLHADIIEEIEPDMIGFELQYLKDGVLHIYAL